MSISGPKRRAGPKLKDGIADPYQISLSDGRRSAHEENVVRKVMAESKEVSPFFSEFSDFSVLTIFRSLSSTCHQWRPFL